MAEIHRLARIGDLHALRLLIEASEDVRRLVNEADDRGYSPLYYAVSSRAPIEVVDLLLQSGGDPSFVKVGYVPALPANWPEIYAQLESGETDEPPIAPEVASWQTEFREPLLRAAVTRGDPAIIELLRRHGADFSYRDEHGYTAMLDAVYGSGDRLPIVKHLISLGLELEETTSYGESAIRVAYGFGKFEVVASLLDADADESGLDWTPLMRAVAVGTIADVERELEMTPDLGARDTLGRTALHLALLKGEPSLVRVLLEHGADLTQTGQGGASSLSYAVESGNVLLVEWLVQSRCAVDGRDPMGRTCLSIAAERGRHEMVRALLRMGANPNAKLDYTTVMECAGDRETILTLLEHGANPGDLRHDTRRIVLDLGEVDADALREVTREQYVAGRFPREGESNPEERNDPFWLAMIRSGVNAYWAREHFADPASFSCGIQGKRAPAVWCADRFGQSLTILRDGRVVLIAGEHEDSYDPDFCIYNDVFVFGPDGEIRIFTYPRSTFPPTDFHSATLVGEDIYIIGSLGYLEDRTGGTPVFRLSTLDWHIESVATTGSEPGPIYKHRATLIDSDTILVEGGTLHSVTDGKWATRANDAAYRLSLGSMTWSRDNGN